MAPDFWLLVQQAFIELGYSKQRIDYIVKKAITTDTLIAQYRYGNLSVPDIISITKPLEVIGYEDAMEMYRHGREDLVWIGDPRHGSIVSRLDAEFACLKYRRFPYG